MASNRQNDAQESSVLQPNQNFDLEKFPYLAFMVHATKSGLLTPGKRVPKKVIEQWLKNNWPVELGNPTPTKLATMATFLRRPEDEMGGIHGKGQDP